MIFASGQMPQVQIKYLVKISFDKKNTLIVNLLLELVKMIITCKVREIRKRKYT